MEAPSSPTSTASFLSEDEWDIVTDESQDGRQSPPPISGSEADPDEIHNHTSQGKPTSIEYWIASNPSFKDTYDVLSDSSDNFDDAEQGPGALLRESDRRVSSALAAPLSSTLDSFRDPLPSYVLASSLSSSDSGSGLVLSFPDPLTAQEPITPIDEPKPQERTKLKEQTAVVASTPLHISETSTAPSIDYTVVLEGNRPEAPIWAAEADAAVQHVTVTEKDAEAIRKLALRAKRAKFLESIDSVKPRTTTTARARRPSIARLLQTQSPTVQSWTTPMYEGTHFQSKYKLKTWFSIVSVLVLVLGSALYAVRSRSTTPTPVMMVHPAPQQLTYANARAGSAYATLIAGNTAQPTMASSVLLQTPGAGPSTATTGHKSGVASTVKSTNAVIVPDTKADMKKACQTGNTRGGPSTPLPPPIRSGFWSKGKGKEKETEVVEIVLHSEDDSSETKSTLLLEGPKAALTLGYIYRDVLTNLKSSFAAFEDVGGGGMMLSKARFDELIDELVNRILIRTADILREITKTLLTDTPNLIQPGVEAAKKLARGVKSHHLRAGWTARKSLRAVIGGVQAHHERVKNNCKRMESGLRAAAKEGHRFLAEALAEVQDV